MEIVYVGVVPEFRRRGLAKLLLRQALHVARRSGARRVTVVVDGRNTPARRLYDAFAFAQATQRDAYLHRPRAAEAV